MPFEFTCTLCGARVVRERSPRPGTVHIFCSLAHHGEWRRAHAGDRDASGRRRAQALFALAEAACERCGVPAEVRHHRDENPRNNVPENVAFLCRACHMKHHNAVTHCKYGHEFTPTNTYTHPVTGVRQCRTCNARRQRETKARRRHLPN
jgi:hypothetical protein